MNIEDFKRAEEINKVLNRLDYTIIDLTGILNDKDRLLNVDYYSDLLDDNKAYINYLNFVIHELKLKKKELQKEFDKLGE